MNGRDRFLCALENGRPDRLPCQVHSWMQYYLQTYLGGVDQYAAYEHFGMDPVIYVEPTFLFDTQRLEKEWRVERTELPSGKPEETQYQNTVTTPDGILTERYAFNQYTHWNTEHIIKTPEDFEIWSRYAPRPIAVDWTPVLQAKERIGGNGIVRGSFYDFGQGSPWQSFSSAMFGTEEAIYACIDEPEWVHHVLETLLVRKLEVIELAGPQALDLVETGGGGGSSTVISPALHREFCLPYDQRQIEALHRQGTKVVYHLCGGLMPLLETVVENGADALETMTPPEMGGDCDLKEATRRVGDRLAFIGGFDQGRGFERGDPQLIRQMVQKLFEACPDGGFIISPSDHFFFGDPQNIQAFVDACRACVY